MPKTLPFSFIPILMTSCLRKKTPGSPRVYISRSGELGNEAMERGLRQKSENRFIEFRQSIIRFQNRFVVFPKSIVVFQKSIAELQKSIAELKKSIAELQKSIIVFQKQIVVFQNPLVNLD